MNTECNKTIKLSSTLQKYVSFNFDGGNITSDGGFFLIIPVDEKLDLTNRISSAINDICEQSKITHTQSEIIKQRLYQNEMTKGLAYQAKLKYEETKENQKLSASFIYGSESWIAKVEYNHQ